MRWFWILGLLAAQAAYATTNQIEFSLGRGSPESSIQANGSAESEGDRGHAWSADWLHQNGPYVYWGIGGGHFNSADHTSSTFVPNPNTISTISSRSTSIFLLSRVDLAPPSRLVPYLIVGSGWVRTSITATAATATPTTLIDESHSTLGYMAGLGMDLPFTDRLFIGAEARYQSAFQRNFNLTPEGQALTGQGSVQSTMKVLFLSVKAGIKY
jgi:opacity protein-like surface antigen